MHKGTLFFLENLKKEGGVWSAVCDLRSVACGMGFDVMLFQPAGRNLLNDMLLHVNDWHTDDADSARTGL